MPEVEGQTFPEHVHHEYPKALYPGGRAHDTEGRAVDPVIVSNAEEEEAAAADGFVQVIDPDPVGDAPEEGQEATEGVDAGEGALVGEPTPTEALAGLADAEEADEDKTEAEDVADEVTTPLGTEPLPEDSAVNDGETPDVEATHDDAPQDGHDDDTGRFVRGPANHGRPPRKK